VKALLEVPSKRSSLMRTLSILNIRTAVIVSALAVALVSPALHAQNPFMQSQVDIPFAFEAGLAHFTAGKYILSAPREHILVVQGTTRSGLTMSSYETSLTPASESKVVFYRYGNQYFLREVWIKGKVDHLRCVESKAEEEARRPRRAYDHASLANRTYVEIALLQSPQ
jgi:hypothetical protein